MSYPVNLNGQPPAVVQTQVTQLPGGGVVLTTTTTQVVPGAVPVLVPVVTRGGRQVPGTRGNKPVVVVSRGSIPTYSGVQRRSPEVYDLGISARTGQPVLRKK